MPQPTPPPTFAALGLRQELADAVAALGYEEPTPVQRETIPLLLEGRDVLGQAGTGTGKTAAFALPMLQRIGPDRPAPRQPRGLVLVPTRELAMQVAEAIHKYGKGEGMHVLPLYGGAPMHQQMSSLARGAHVVAATPGRALDHMRRGTLKLDQLQILVLDEADEMLDMGFADDLDAILKATPESRQTALFSATMPSRILSIAERHLPQARRASRSPGNGRPPARCRASARSPTSSTAPTSRRRSRASSTWKIPWPRWCSAARGWRSSRWSRRSTRTATAPRRCTAACCRSSAIG